MTKRPILILAVLLLTATVGLRTARLTQRPMHTDEAVQAIKFGQLLENNFYRYDKLDHHGPTLNYFTLIGAWFTGANELSDIGELTLRIVPVFFAVLLILLSLLLIDGLGPVAATWAIALTAVSPAFVFYNRYYIHETLLACFTFGLIACGWRYCRSKNIIWAMLAGICAALMYATKETCIIAFGSMGLAILLTLIIRRKAKSDNPEASRKIDPLHIVAAIACAAVVSGLFFSSFFTNPKGIADSLAAYTIYFNRAGQDTEHIHPWYYYLKTLIYYRNGSGPVWSEAFILILAVAGLIAAIKKKVLAGVDPGLFLFICFYTIIMTVVYSVIRYKTPWCALGFWHGMILLAGVGAAELTGSKGNVFGRFLIGLVLGVGITHLGWQAYSASFTHYDKPNNPYVYAHTSSDVFAITERVKELADVHPAGFDMPIEVICQDDDYWPLPWYLRSFGNISWQDKVDKDAPSAPVIIASPSAEAELLQKLYDMPEAGNKNLYLPLFDSYVELRPRVELRGYVTNELWDSFQGQREKLTEQIK